MGIHTYGTNAVDWESRVDMPRLRQERLAKLQAELERSDLGALLTFDFHNIRYMTGTHIGTWAMDKLIRFALLPRGGKPIVWDFGSAARHHQLYNPWLSGAQVMPDGSSAPYEGARAGISTLRGAIPPGADRAGTVADQDRRGPRPVRPHPRAGRGRHHRDAGAGGLRPARASPWSTASRCSSRPGASRPATRSPC